MTESEFETLIVAPNPTIAGMLRSQVEAQGIPAYIVGGLLSDEFAKAQEAFGNSGVEIRVPKDRLEEARKILAESRAAAATLEQAETETGEGANGSDGPGPS